MNSDFIRRTGTIYTPVNVASALSVYASGLVTTQHIRVLEPSVGDGSFITALDSDTSPEKHYTVIDINDVTIKTLKRLYKKKPDYKIRFIRDDFLAFALDNMSQEFDLVIGNPPFIRKHNYSEEFKLLLDRLAMEVEYDRRDIKNSWVAFVLLAEKLLSNRGVMAFILPYELMNVSYGQKLLKKIFSKFHKIEIFVPDEKAFKDLDQDAIAIVAQKHSQTDGGIYINRVTSLENLQPYSSTKMNLTKAISLSVDLKSFLFGKGDGHFIQSIRDEVGTLSDHCDSAPGVVSAANEFFILTQAQVDLIGAHYWVLPILKKGSYVSQSPIFSKSEFRELAKSAPTFLLNVDDDDESEFSEKLIQYLHYGVSQKIHLRYKCVRRDPWYRVPITPVTEGFFFKRCHSHPRLFINAAKVLVTDTAYRITIRNDSTMRGLCFSFYNSLTLLFAEINGRFYGGGVLELSPLEFKSLPLAYYEPTDLEFESFIATHTNVDNDIEDLLNFGDNWLVEKLGFEKSKLIRIRSMWRVARAHRLRHGGN